MMSLIALVFLVPIWRIAQSKGYNGKVFVLVPSVLSCLAVVAQYMLPPISSAVDSWLGFFAFGVPSATLGLVSILKARPGAPGKVWLTITFPCPACRAAISFPRELDGLVRQCPKCREIVTVSDPNPSPNN